MSKRKYKSFKDFYADKVDEYVFFLLRPTGNFWAKMLVVIPLLLFSIAGLLPAWLGVPVGIIASMTMWFFADVSGRLQDTARELARMASRTRAISREEQ